MIVKNVSRERCLILCKDQVNRSNITSLIANFGYRTDCMSVRKEAIRSFIANKHSLIMIDGCFLPAFPHRMIELFKIAHRNPAVIILSEDYADVTPYAFLNEGVFDIVKLPLRTEELAFAVRRTTEQSKLITKNHFYKDLIINIGLAIPILMLLTYLLANHR
jgi:DNA-binding NtrC family response regulator